MNFTDIPLDNHRGYFLIAAPSTWPPFQLKMAQIIDLLKKVSQNYKIVMVYIAEAHADDVWPLGYGKN